MFSKALFRSSLTLMAASALALAAPLAAAAQPIHPAPARPAASASAASCTATFVIAGQWPGGFVANVVVTNTGTVAITNWTVTITFPSAPRVTQVWGATITQSGPIVVAQNPGLNTSLPPGGSTSFGFAASGSAPTGTPAITCTAR